MPAAGGIRAGAAFIELSVRDTKFIRGLQSALARLKAFGISLQNVGAGIRTAGLRLASLGVGLVTPLLLSARAFSKMGDQLEKMSRRTGASVEALSELGYAAELSGTNLEAVETGLRRMQKTIAGAAEGGKEPSKALETLGVNLGEIIQLAPDEQLELIGKRLTALTDPTIRAAAAMAIFGRSGTELLPMMEEMGALRAEARRLGLVMSTEDAQAAAALNDAMDRLWAAFRRIVAAVGGALAPMLSGLSDRLVELAGRARNWFEQNKGLIVSILKIGTVAIGAGIALTALGGIISAVGTLFVAFATVASAALSFLLSPIGLVIAAVAGLAATIAWATGATGEALQWLGGRFAALQNFALESFQGIKDALASGDVALAAKVLWTSLQVVWRAGINTLKGWWLDFKGWFLSLTSDIFWGAVSLVAQAWFGLRKLWVKTLNFLSDTLRSFANGAASVWDSITGWVAKRMNDVRGQFDPEMDVEMANKLVDMDTKRWKENRERSQEESKSKGEDELKQIDTEREFTLAAIADEADAEARARDEQFAQERQDSEAALAAAKAEWKIAVEEAKTKREAALAESALAPAGEAPALPPAWDFGEIEASIPDIEEKVRQTLDVAGMFGAEAAGRMGIGSTTEERTAKATEETAKNTKKIATRLEDGVGLVFD